MGLSGCGDETIGYESADATDLSDTMHQTSDGGLSPGDLGETPTDLGDASDAGADVFSTVDAQPYLPDQGRLDAGGATDAGTDAAMEINPRLTWTQCRQRWAEDRLSDLETTFCDQRYRQPPVDRIFGIRFVFLNPVDEPAEWIAPRLDAINRIFEPAGMSFIQAAVVNAGEGQIQVVQDGPSLSLEDRITDLRIHLEMPDARLQACLDLLKARLLESGAHGQSVAALNAESEFDNRQFLFLMSRATPADIYFVVTDQINDELNVGGWALPPFHPVPTLERSIVAVRSTAPSVTIPAHELGHYFGLKHPHAHSRQNGNEHLFQSGRLVPAYRARDTHHIFDVLQTHFGPTYDDPYVEAYPAYDEPMDRYADFEALRFALMDTWVRWRLTYHPGLTAYESLGAFVADARGRASIGQLNYISEANNCQWRPDSQTFGCGYPNGDEALTAASPLLNNRILFDEGREVNVMSYIRQTGDEAIPRGYGLFEEQIDVLHVSANAPQRLSLRNYALDETH